MSIVFVRVRYETLRSVLGATNIKNDNDNTGDGVLPYHARQGDLSHSNKQHEDILQTYVPSNFLLLSSKSLFSDPVLGLQGNSQPT